MTSLFIVLEAWKSIAIMLLFWASPLVIAALLCAANDLLNKLLGNRP